MLDFRKVVPRITPNIILVLGVLLFPRGTVPIAREAAESVKIGVLAKRGAERCLEKWRPTAEYLTREIPGYSFEIVPLDYDAIYGAVEREEIDFILANPSFYAGLESLYDARRIATLKNLCLGEAHTIYGGVIFCRADRKEMKNLGDLKGKSYMAVDETSLGGWQMAWRKLKEHGIDPYRDFADLSFGGTHDAVVYAVRDGEVDAGTVRTDALERMAAEGKIRLDDFHVFAYDHTVKKYCNFPFVHSTNTYPEWPFAKVRHTSNELAEKVAVALIKMSPDSPAAMVAKCAGWTIPHNYQPVHDCLKYLQIIPYEDYGKVTFQDMLRQYLPWFLGALVAVVLIVLFALYVIGLNRRLQQAVAGQRKELTERKRADEILKRQAAFVNNNPAPVLQMDKDLRIIAANPAARLILEHDLIGESLDNKLPKITPSVVNVLFARESTQIEEEIGNNTYLFTIRHDDSTNTAFAYGADMTERKRAEEALHARTHDLRERVKELNCLHSISELIEAKDIPLEKIIQGTVDLIPPGWQFPEITCARIILEGREFKTGNFEESKWKQTCDIVSNDKIIGTIEVYYAKQMPELDEGPFLKEERNLIKLLAERLGKIIERIRAEEALRESEEKVRLLLNSTAEAIYGLDLQGNCTFCNPECLKVLGYDSESELIGKNMHNLIHHSHVDGTSYPMEDCRIYRSFLKGKGTHVDDEVLWRADGSSFPCEYWSYPMRSRDEIIGSVVTFLDITERKRAEDILSRTVNQYTAMINTVPVMMYLEDSEGRYLIVNEELCKTVGKTADQIIGRKTNDIFPREQAEIFLEVERSVIESTQPVINREKRFTDSDGEIRWVNITKVPIHDVNGEISGIVGSIQDITEQHVAREQLMQSDKLAAIGILAAGVAHEINNPIGYVSSNLNTMSKYIEKIKKYIDEVSPRDSRDFESIKDITDDFKDAIDESLEGVTRVKNIVTDLKSFSRVDRAEKENTDLNDGLNSTLNIVWNELKYHCKVEKDFGDLPDLYCIPNQLNQVFMNILLNAGQATAGKDGLIKIKTRADGDNIYVSIKDNGCGIPGENIRKIFEPFFTTKEVGKGTGLGLSLVFDIIKKHKGHIDVKSEVGAGTEFIVTLPLEGVDEEKTQPAYC